MLFLRRLVMISVLWGLLTGGAVFVCTSGDSDDFRNRPPVARDDSYSIPAGTTLIGAVRAVDPDGDLLVYRVVSGPEIGQLESFNGSSGAFRYVSGEPGSDRFDFTASDGRLESNVGRISIQVAENAGYSALAGTLAGPVALSGEGLVLLAADGPVGLDAGITGLSAGDSGGSVRWADGRAGCLDPWAGLRAEGPCGATPDPSAGIADPFRQGTRLRAIAEGQAVRIEQRLGAGPWTVLARPPVPGDGAALHFDVSAPGRLWLAIHAEGMTRLLASDDSGVRWHEAAMFPGRVVALAGLGAGRHGVLALRAAPEGPLLLDLREERRNDR
jgi:hypothetical protein